MWQGTWDEWFEAFLDGSAPVPMAAPSGSGGGDHDWFSHTLGWWAMANAHPASVLWVRYEALLAQPLAEVRRVASFVTPSTAHDDARLAEIVRASSFGQMKARHEADEANVGARVEGEAAHFRKGKSGDWRNHMSLAQRRRFAVAMAERLAGSGLEDAFEKDDALLDSGEDVA